MKERLQKVLAQAGVASRRASEKLIIAGRVTVNGRIVTELGTKVDLNQDTVKVDGKPIEVKERFVYYILHKPRGYLTTVEDDRGRRTVMQLLEPVKERIYPVGRLDYDSEGLLLLTNDGQLAHRLMHPRYQVRKFYLVEVTGEVSQAALETLRSGVQLDDGITSSAYVELLANSPQKSLLKIGIHEGRNRQIRRMCQAVGLPVRRLIRTQFGPIKLGKLSPGKFSQLTAQEVGKLKQAVKHRGK